MTEALPPHSEELSLFLGVQGSRITHIVDAYARQAVAADRAVRAGDAAPDGVWVPREPTEAMKRAGGHVNSEWLNDNAPIGEMRYAMPMGGVWQAMLAAAPQPIRVDKGVEAAIRAAASNALDVFQTICSYADSADLGSTVIEEIGDVCDELRAVLSAPLVAVRGQS